jgi:hypothetical protein
MRKKMNQFYKTKNHKAKIVGKETHTTGLIFKKLIYFLVYKIEHLKDPVTQKPFVHRIATRMNRYYNAGIGDEIDLTFESFDGFLWTPKEINE